MFLVCLLSSIFLPVLDQRTTATLDNPLFQLRGSTLTVACSSRWFLSLVFGAWWVLMKDSLGYWIRRNHYPHSNLVSVIPVANNVESNKCHYHNTDQRQSDEANDIFLV